MDALRAAWQVTIIEPEIGRNDRLWPTLARLAESAGASEAAAEGETAAKDES